MLRQLKFSGLAPRPGAGEGAGLIAEQLAFHQILRNGGAVDFDERAAGAAAAVVQGLRHDLLAYAALPHDADAGLAGGGPGGGAQHGYERLAVAQHIAKGGGQAVLAGQLILEMLAQLLEVFQFPVGLDQLGHVLHQRQRADDPPVLIQGDDVRAHVQLSGMDVGNIPGQGDAGLQHLVDAGQRLKFCQMAADDLLPLDAEHFQIAVVDVAYPGLGVNDQDAFVDAVQDIQKRAFFKRGVFRRKDVLPQHGRAV